MTRYAVSTALSTTGEPAAVPLDAARAAGCYSEREVAPAGPGLRTGASRSAMARVTRWVVGVVLLVLMGIPRFLLANRRLQSSGSVFLTGGRSR